MTCRLNGWLGLILQKRKNVVGVAAASPRLAQRLINP